MGRMRVTCKSHTNTHGHMWVTCRSHANTYRAHVGHVQVTCEYIQGTCGSHAGHMRVTIECVWSVLRLRNPLLSYRKAGGCQITHGNTNKLWKASLLAGPRSAAACEPESLGPSAPCFHLLLYSDGEPRVFRLMCSCSPILPALGQAPSSLLAYLYSQPLESQVL